VAALGLTRRELLAAFLGTPFALAACRRREPAIPDGELVGADDVLGHRVRDHGAIQPASWRRTPVVIVGGGVAGLAAAWRLLRGGFRDFTLMELERAPGGTARSGRNAVTSFPWGAHYIPAPLAENRWLVTLLDELGVLEARAGDDGEPVVAEQFLCRDPEERLYYRGRWYEGLYLRAGASADDRAQFDRFHQEIDRWVGWRDVRGRRAFAIPIATGSDDAEVTALDRIPMTEWMRAHGFTSARLQWLVDYACRDDYGLRAQDTSAWAGLFYFCSRVTRPGAESRPLLTWPEGNGRLVSHLYAAAKDRALLATAAAEVVPRERGVDVVTIDGFGHHADQVIFAAPQFVARHVIRDDPRDTKSFDYGAWMVANLHLSDRPREDRGFPLAWDNVLHDSPALGYVVATHQSGLDRGPSVFTYYYPLCDADGRKRLLSTGRREWAEIALADLSRAHPDLRSLTTRLDVMRWGHAMIRPRTGFVWGAERRRAGQPFRGIHFAHSDLSGIALFEEAFHHGIRAAEEVLAARGMAI
jgi:phytoene dehydrogenase-like protein